MNRTQLIEAIAEQTETTKVAAEKMVQALETTVTKALAAGDKVQLTGFGSFEAKETAARKGRNPKTGEEIDIAAGVRISFSAGQTLKDAVSK